MAARNIYLIIVYSVLACILLFLSSRVVVCTKKTTGMEYNGTNGGDICLNCHPM